MQWLSPSSNRTNTLLEQLCAGMVKANFYGALWECVLSSPIVRLPAITFILSQVDRKVPMAEQKYFLGNNRTVMVSRLKSQHSQKVGCSLEKSGFKNLLLYSV